MNELLLQNFLERKTRQHLIHMARMLLIKVKSSQTKSEIAEKITWWILEFPLHLIMQLPPVEVERLRLMVYSENHTIPHNALYFPDCLDYIGLIESKENRIQPLDVMPSDLAEALRKVYESPLKFITDHDYWNGSHQLILGLINLYGMLMVPELKELAKSFDPKLKNQELDYVINRSFLLKSLKIKIEGDVFFFSPFIDDPVTILTAIDQHESLSHAIFSRHQVMDAGLWGAPMPPGNHETSRLLVELDNVFCSNEEKTWLISELWMMLNNGYTPLEMMRKIKEKKPFSKKTQDSMISLFGNWSNHIPRWKLKGNSSYYLSMLSDR